VKALLADIDYVAMDIKAPPGDISRVVSFDLSDAPIWQCADMLMDSGVDYEFRTTFMPTLDVADIEAMARRVRGARRYIIQQYRKTDSPTLSPEPHSRETIKKAAEAAGKYVREVVIRGI
jgi:pyruvate formate lyase activating enzyme